MSMAIKNKDGTVYRLRGPNPLLSEQDIWNAFSVHNMKWAGEVFSDQNEVIGVKSDFQVKNEFLEELEEKSPTQDDIKVIESRPEPKPNVQEPEIRIVEKPPIVSPPSQLSEPVEQVERVERLNETFSLPPDIERQFIYCLPATIRERKDDLYGDQYRTIQYGNPFSFEAVIARQDDLFIELWTTASVSHGSVIFPRVGAKRWWRVQEKKEKSGGWLLTAIPSDYQPSFQL